jgi:hypothetical protein
VVAEAGSSIEAEEVVERYRHMVEDLQKRPAAG